MFLIFKSREEKREDLKSKFLREFPNFYSQGNNLERSIHEMSSTLERSLLSIRDSNKRQTDILHYSSKLSMSCQDCGSRARLTVTEEVGREGGLIKNNSILIECPECGWSFHIADTKIGARFLCHFLDELETPGE